MGPILDNATRPKLSLAEFLSVRREARPMPMAMIKGTVMGPVVTPPESKATARNSLGTRKDAQISSRYRTISSLERSIWNLMRRMARARNIPTPTATVWISTRLGTEGTCWASTCRSGSEMVIIAPMTKPMSRIISTLRVLEIWTPMPSPMGVMAISAPSWNKPIPRISMTAPVTNITKLPSSIGTRKILISSTIPVIGRTAERDSMVFSLNFGFKFLSFPHTAGMSAIRVL